ELKISSTTDSISTPVFINLGWIPQEMIKKNSSTYIYDVFNNRGAITFWRASPNYLGLWFYIQSPNAFEQCINLYQTAQPFHSSLWLTEIYQDTGYTSRIYGDRYCSGNNCLRNLTPAQISKLCQVCKDKNACTFYYFWR
ncbi:MAG: hypothetical protein IJ852_01905, partial [Alphaproteobacteria bacterium]|nr:hypothetical protein [Alphaproteobacteria bacterium]